MLRRSVALRWLFAPRHSLPKRRDLSSTASVSSEEEGKDAHLGGRHAVAVPLRVAASASANGARSKTAARVGKPAPKARHSAYFQNKALDNIGMARQNNQPLLVMESLSAAMKSGLQSALTLQHLSDALWACTEKPTSEEAQALTPAVYGLLMAQQMMDRAAYEQVASICAANKNGPFAILVGSDYLQKCGVPSERFLYHTLSALAADPRELPQAEAIIANFYRIFHDHVQKQKWSGDGAFYATLILKADSFHNNALVLCLLKDMVSEHISPPVPLCLRLLEDNLLFSNVEIVRLLSTWFVKKFDHKLEYGQLARMLQVASGKKDPKLAHNALLLMDKHGYPVSRADCASAVLASLDSSAALDVDGAIAMVVYVQHKYGLDLVDDIGSADRIVETIALDVSCTSRKFEEYFFKLVDVKKTHRDTPVPRALALALVLAAGRSPLMTEYRLSSLRQEYCSLFELGLDVHAHNAFMRAHRAFHEQTADSRSSSGSAPSSAAAYEHVLGAFNDMEAAGVAPDAMTYSILLSTMADAGQTHNIDAVIDHLDATGVRPVAQHMRRAIVRCIDLGDVGSAEKLLHMMKRRAQLVTRRVRKKFTTATLDKAAVAQPSLEDSEADIGYGCGEGESELEDVERA